MRRVAISVALLVVLAGAGCGSPPPSTTPTTSLPSVSPTGATTSPQSVAPSAPAGTATGLTSPTAPAPSDSATTDVTYGTDFTLSGDALSFQPLTWYVGAKAQARCKEKKIKSDFEWCNTYYYEDAGARASATLAPAVTVALLGDGTVPKPSTRSALVSNLRAQNVGYAEVSRTADGVVDFEEVFTP